MHNVSRRRFMIGAAAGAAALTFPIRRVLGANETINMGFIGTGGRGTHSAGWFSDLKKTGDNVNVASLCDADAKIMATTAKKYPEAKTAQDLRRVLDDKNVDAVCISTCNHWHALAAVWALQAGKHVYVEKPVSQTVLEGRRIVEAARKYNKIVQGGTQQRSDPVQEEIRAFLKSGAIGKMQWIRGNRFGVRQSIGKRDTPLKPPADVDYNLWLGPAQDLPMFREKFHYDWHWVWNTGSGEMGNWGVHVLDDIRNMLNDQSTLPRRILSGGGRVAWNDAGESPNVHFVYFDTGVVPVIFSLSNLPLNQQRKTASPHFRNIQSGYVIQCEGGYYAGARGGGWAYDKDGKKLKQFKGDGGGAHAKNFIDAIRKNDRAVQKAEIEQTHYSSAWCHLANIAFRLGGGYTQEKALAADKSFAPWGELLEQYEKHLADNGVQPTDGALKVSTMLELDPAKETFVGESAKPEALAMLTREYRKGFEMPEKV